MASVIVGSIASLVPTFISLASRILNDSSRSTLRETQDNLDSTTTRTPYIDFTRQQLNQLPRKNPYSTQNILAGLRLGVYPALWSREILISKGFEDQVNILDNMINMRVNRDFTRLNSIYNTLIGILTRAQEMDQTGTINPDIISKIREAAETILDRTISINDRERVTQRARNLFSILQSEINQLGRNQVFDRNIQAIRDQNAQNIRTRLSRNIELQRIQFLGERNRLPQSTNLQQIFNPGQINIANVPVITNETDNNFINNIS